MKIWQREINVQLINAYYKNTMIDHIGIEFTEVGDNFLMASMPVDHRTKQPAGIMHGGASCVLAETMGSIGANFCVDFPQHYCVGLEINTNHIRSITEGYVIGKAKPFHVGKTTQVWGIEISDKHNKLISINRLTLAILKRKQ